MDLKLQDFRAGYVQLCRYVLEHGQPVSPRGQATLEIPGGRFTVQDVTRALPLGVNRKLSLPVAAVEALQLIAGVSRPWLMVWVNPTFNQFREVDGTFWGAYGPRVGPQVPFTLDRLREDPHTREAVITIYDGRRDFVQAKDIPCTLSLHFMIRRGQLDLHVTMRSNDVWWGAAYDVFQFTQLQLTLAGWLGLPAGRYVHTANSLHLYTRDIPAIEALDVQRIYEWPYVPNGLTGWSPGATIQRAVAILDAAEDGSDPEFDLTDAEAWYLKQLRHRAAPRVD